MKKSPRDGMRIAAGQIMSDWHRQATLNDLYGLVDNGTTMYGLAGNDISPVN